MDPSLLPALIERAREAEFRHAAGDLLYFARRYCWFEDKDASGVVVPFHPWPAQEEALAAIAAHKFTLFLKARQVGVTWVALIYCAHDLIFSLGHSVIALSKTQKDAEELVRRFGLLLSHMRSLLAGGGITFSQKKEEITLTDGKNTSVFKSFAASKSAGRSFTANILLLDEWAFQAHAREIWTSAYPTVNRPTGGKVIGISTIKRGSLFEDLWREDNLFYKIFIPATADPRRDAAWYEATKRNLGAKIRQEYPRTAEEALADAEGCFFHEFDPLRHVCEPFPIPPDWEIYTAMDYGLDMLAHYRIAVDSERRCYVFHELYESGLLVSEAAAKIKAWEREAPREAGARLPKLRLAPPDLFARELTSGKSQALAFEEEGLRLVKSSNDRVTGWLCLKELLKLRDTPAGQKPRLLIFSTCRHLIRTLSSLAVDERNPNDCAREPHELTHAPDALRYFAIHRFPLSHEQAKEEDAEAMPAWTADMWEDYENASPEERAYLRRRWRHA